MQWSGRLRRVVGGRLPGRGVDQVQACGVVVDRGGFGVPLGRDLAGLGLQVVDLGQQDLHEAVDAL